MNQRMWAILKISFIPMDVLIAMIVLFFLFGFFKLYSLKYVMPFIIFLSGFFVMLYGAFSSFGSKTYINSMIKMGAKIGKEDILFINKQQLVMTLIFLLIGGLFLLVGYLLSII